MAIIIIFLLLLLLSCQSMLLMIDSLFIIDWHSSRSISSSFITATDTHDIATRSGNSIRVKSGSINKCILPNRIQPSFMTKENHHHQQQKNKENGNHGINSIDSSSSRRNNNDTKEVHRQSDSMLLAFIPPTTDHSLNSTAVRNNVIDSELIPIISINQQQPQNYHNDNNNQNVTSSIDYYNNIKKWLDTMFTTPVAATLENKMKETIEKKTNIIMKTATKAGERSSERRGVAMLEKKIMSSSSTSKAAAKTILSNVADRSTTGANSRRVAERILLNREDVRLSEQAVKHVGEGFWLRITRPQEKVQRLSEQTVKHVGERWLTAAERKMMSTSMKAAVHTNKHVPYTLLERIINRFKSSLSSPVKHSTERVINRNTQRLFTPHSSSKVLIRQHHKVLERTAERYGKRSIGQRLVLLGSSSSSKRSIQFLSKTMLLRFGNLCLIALPILGGLFSCSLCYHDIHRVIDENDISTQMMFALAGSADFIDAIIHFIITYVLIRQVQYPKMIHFIENISTKCMYVSTISVILGEMICTILQHRQQQRQDINSIKNNSKKKSLTTTTTTTTTNEQKSLPPAPVSS